MERALERSEWKSEWNVECVGVSLGIPRFQKSFMIIYRSVNDVCVF